MKYKISQSNRFKKDARRAKKRGYNMNLLKDVILSLAAGKKLDERYDDHLLSGEYQNLHECHITPDWLLIYDIQEDELILLLSRTGTHSDLF